MRDIFSTVKITISPATASLAVGQTQQFTAAVTGTSNTSVVWTVNGIGGGNSTVGTISSTGLYRAPDAVPSPNPVTVTATSAANAAKSASANVTVTPQLIALDPIVTLQDSPAFGLGVLGRGFTATSQVLFGGTVKPTTLINAIKLVADISPGDVGATGTFPVAVRDGEATSPTLDFYVVPALVRREVSVASGTEAAGADIEVVPATLPSLSLLAVGIDDTAAGTGVILPRGSQATLLLVGEGIVPGTYYIAGGNTDGVSVAQPLAADFVETTDGKPAVRLRVSISPTAALGVRNILVRNVAGQSGVFVGGLQVTE